MAIFDFLRLPKVTATEAPGGRLRVAVEITGINPGRTLTGEELLMGFESLNPPTIQAKDTTEAKRLAVLCTTAALAATDGYELGPVEYGWTAYSVGYAAAGALVALGYDA